MRFLILTQYYPPEVGAAQVRLSALAHHLTSYGHEVEVVTALPSYPQDRIFPGYRGRAAMVRKRGHMRVYRTWLFPATGRGWKRMVGYLSFAATSLPALLAAARPDILFVESPPPTLALSGWLAGRLRSSKVVLNVSDLWPDSALALGLARPGIITSAAERLERWAYAHADFVTAVTDGIRATLIQDKGVIPEKVLFLPNGVDTELFRPRPYDPGLAATLGLTGRRVVTLAGSLGFAVGLDVILDAAALTRDRSVTYLIVGGGSEYERLRAALRERSLDNVVLTGPKSLVEVANIYSVTDVGLMTLKDSPLFQGTRPARVYPAMASGKPIVYSGAGEGARMIEEAGAGIVVEPQNGPALAAAVGRLVEDAELARELGENGRSYVQRTLSWDRLVGAWLSDLEGRLESLRVDV